MHKFLAVLAVVLIPYFVLSSNHNTLIGYHTTFAPEGSTLYGITDKHCPDNMYLNEYRDFVCELNSSDLQAGAEVKIPIIKQRTYGRIILDYIVSL